MSGGLDKLHRSELEALVVDMAKTQERFRQSIANIVREFEDEGDRVYLGSTNDADELRDLDEQLTETDNWLACKWMHGADLWADLRQLREEKTEAAATITALKAEVAALREALAEIVEHCSNTGYGNPIVNERIVDRCDETARAALERPKP